jgi:hypothetical protein
MLTRMVIREQQSFQQEHHFNEDSHFGKIISKRGVDLTKAVMPTEPTISTGAVTVFQQVVILPNLS